MSKNVKTIAIVDSGIGGVSILNKLISKFKVGNYIYYADNLNMPYGNKTEQFLKQRVIDITKTLKTDYCADIVIIACNTASSVIRDIEIDNVVTMQFGENEKYFATPLTAKMLGQNVIADGILAKEIERHINTAEIEKVITKHIKRHKINKFKQIVLGCTHFELVADIFKKHCTKTEVLCNSDKIINKVHIIGEELNIVVKLSLASKRYEEKILSIIKR